MISNSFGREPPGHKKDLVGKTNLANIMHGSNLQPQILTHFGQAQVTNAKTIIIGHAPKIRAGFRIPVLLATRPATNSVRELFN
jgi:hypothetical protein